MASQAASRTMPPPPPPSLLGPISQTDAPDVGMPLQPATGSAVNKKPGSPQDTPAKGKEQARMHRRSRTGCFICRLRRKKCDEGKPFCRACNHLGLVCEYKRPLWWSNNDQRRQQKEIIKEIIKRTKLNEKNGHPHPQGHSLGHALRPPIQNLSVSHSHSPALSISLNHNPSALHTPSSSTTTTTTTIHTAAVTDLFPDSIRPTDLDPFAALDGLGLHYDGGFSSIALSNPALLSQQLANFGMPFEIDIKTERTVINGSAVAGAGAGAATTTTTTTTTAATASSIPQQATGITSVDDELDQIDWVPKYLEPEIDGSAVSTAPSSLDQLFDFNTAPTSATTATATGAGTPACDLPPAASLELDQTDQHLLTHFLTTVLPLIFPILDASRPGATRNEVVVPALEANETYLHCCLSYAALHLKESNDDGSVAAASAAAGLFPLQSLQVTDNDIMKHRYATISKLCEALNRDTHHDRILEATLAMIFLQCAVGRPVSSKEKEPIAGSLPDIPWHQHFQAATNLIIKLGYPDSVVCTAGPPPFNFSLASWIDILGATMVGRAPIFADTYREKNLSSTKLGLSDLMGCDDQIMFLISEIACLDALKADGMDEVQLCSHIKLLGDHISMAELGQHAEEESEASTSTTPSRQKQLSRAVTTAFRIAARIYLCGLVPDFDRRQPSIINLVNSLTDAMNGVALASATTGVSVHLLDRSLSWPILIGGSIALRGSHFRHLVATRTARMGPALAQFGSYGRVSRILRDVWAVNDAAESRGEKGGMHWREMMAARGWDDLLI